MFKISWKDLPVLFKQFDRDLVLSEQTGEKLGLKKLNPDSMAALPKEEQELVGYENLVKKNTSACTSICASADL